LGLIDDLEMMAEAIALSSGQGMAAIALEASFKRKG
jgi:hypothetical protein